MRKITRRQHRLREGSITSKLLTLRPGETVYFDDTREMPGGRALDGAVQAAMIKARVLTERRFKTSRWTAVQASPACAKPILAVTRVDSVDICSPPDGDT